MHFIIPKNYKYKNKIFGIIDYPTALINIIWNVIIYFILKNINTPISLKAFIFSTLSFPILLSTMLGFNNESPIYTIKYMISFFIRPKVYLFKKVYSNSSADETTKRPPLFKQALWKKIIIIRKLYFTIKKAFKVT